MTSLRHLRNAAAVLAAATSAACTAPAAPAGAPVPAGATAAAIEAEDLRLRVGILAADPMLGRGVGTPGARGAAEYLASEAARLGLRPAGDTGSYFQAVPLERRRTGADVAVVLGGAEEQPTTDEIRFIGGAGGLPAPAHTSGEGPLVYGGYLMDTSAEGRTLTAEQVAGSVMILRLGGPPGSPSAASPRMDLAAAFMPGGPVRAVLIVTDGPAEDFWKYAGSILRNGSLGPAGAGDDAPKGAAFFLVTRAYAERLLGGRLEGERAPRTGLGSFRYSLHERVEAVPAWNVVAVLPGSSAALRSEHVALGSHYDHVGIGEPVDGDSIFNGADDDASGTAALVEIAERYASLPEGERPARSLLFVWHTAEESGLLGSDFFTESPTVPRDSIVAQLNIDMIGRNHPDSLHVIGSRRLSTDLGDLTEAVNRRQAAPFAFDYTMDAPDHAERVYCRSDHYNYARYGIPVVFFTTGLHDDYHQPSDEPDTLDYDKLARVTRLVGDLAGEVASLPARPRVDRPVPPLGTPCV